MATKYSRWHRYDPQGNKQIKRFGIDEIPNPLKEELYSKWERGCGALPPDKYEKVVEAVRAANKGTPKSENTKEKMRIAQAGKPKSEQHRKAMSMAQTGKPKSEAHKMAMRKAKRK